MWIAPKLDWMADDYINPDDWNRIENNIQEVVNYLNSIQYTMPSITTITNRDMTSIDKLNSINRIEGNLESIKNSFLTPAEWLGTKTWSKQNRRFDYTDAIRLETNVKALYDAGFLVFQGFRYCGTFNAGQDIAL